ncbi:hypothetical protein HGH93_21495 [Chitinophaga polysaccharea]|uniref:hypothetical protein n=1 Tax=Chitinophaga polysaccharea TaxID=1293035 RepID=UPI00145544DC|nr:hypothetical protein [Chitinophaga polysaccharea]NLR60699.1 hypothetical protein [Chitinophaga polysaccharea]
MKVDWKGLAQGMYNSIAGEKWIKELAGYRMDTFCGPCEHNSRNAKSSGRYQSIRPDDHCILCGCNLEWKTHQLSSSCPDSRWQAAVTKQEAAAITAIMDKKDAE